MENNQFRPKKNFAAKRNTGTRSFKRSSNNEQQGEKRPFKRFSNEGQGEKRSFGGGDTGFKRPFKRDNNEGGGEKRPFKRFDSSGGGEKRSFGGDRGGGFKRPFKRDGDSSEGGEKRPFKRFDSNGGGEKRSFGGDRGGFKRPFKRDGDSGGGEKRSFGGDRGGFKRPFKRDGDSNEGGEKRPFKRFDSNEGGEKRSFGGDRGGFKRPFKRDGDSNEGGEKRPFKRFDSNEGGEKRSFGGDRGGFKRPFKRDGDSGGGEKRSFGGDRGGFKRPFKRDGDSNEGGEKRPFKRFDSNEGGEKRSFGGDRGGFKRPFKRDGDSGGGEKRSFGGDRGGFKRPFKRDGEGQGEKRPFKRVDGNNGDEKRSFGSDRERSGEKHRTFKPRFNEGEESQQGNIEQEGRKRFLVRKDRNSYQQQTDQPTHAEQGLIRLNRYIANSGVCSRREADDLIAKGKVTVNDEVIIELGYKVKQTDEVKYNGKLMKREKLVYVLLNKPKDYITTLDDPDNRRTVMELVSDACNERIFPVGRLDRDTTGLLLLTNDGELAQRLAHPSYEIKKIYQVDLSERISDEHFTKLFEGVLLEDGWAKVDSAQILNEERTSIGVEIHLGRNRIIRRMFEQLGYEIVKLDRTMYAGLTKKEIARGHWRTLNSEEVIRLKHFNS